MAQASTLYPVRCSWAFGRRASQVKTSCSSPFCALGCFGFGSLVSLQWHQWFQRDPKGLLLFGSHPVSGSRGHRAPLCMFVLHPTGKQPIAMASNLKAMALSIAMACNPIPMASNLLAIAFNSNLETLSSSRGTAEELTTTPTG